jgi:hypothetical protein
MTTVTAPETHWRLCSICKKPIGYRTLYWVCNVSTCTRKRTGLIFCTVSCWDAHVPMMNHRESWAEERTAPTREERVRELSGEKPSRQRKDAPPAPGKSTESPVPKAATAPILRRQRP